MDFLAEYLEKILKMTENLKRTGGKRKNNVGNNK